MGGMGASPWAALSQALDKLIRTPRDLSQVDQPCSVTCLPKSDKKCPSQMPAAGCLQRYGDGSSSVIGVCKCPDPGHPVLWRVWTKAGNPAAVPKPPSRVESPGVRGSWASSEEASMKTREWTEGPTEGVCSLGSAVAPFPPKKCPSAHSPRDGSQTPVPVVGLARLHSRHCAG